MKFGALPLNEAEGAILVHSVPVSGKRLKKGNTLSPDDIKALADAGHESVVAARLESGDVTENDAAEQLAQAFSSDGLRPGWAGTGRCSLFADAPGLLLVDKVRVDKFNAIDEAITLATLPAFERVGRGQMAATFKIIPFSVPNALLGKAHSVRGPDSPLSLARFRPIRAVLVQTTQEGDNADLLDKTREATRARLSAIGGILTGDLVTEHDPAALADALEKAQDDSPDVILILGSSAIVDRRDVVPRAIEVAGGQVMHLGMPVDPGNLTLLAALGEVPVLGLPGSARSHRPHGFDWVLDRIAADIPVTGADIAAMGVGGLLKEVPGRPMPRLKAAPRVDTGSAAAGAVEILILAGGQSRRMGKTNKLLVDIGGTPLIRQVAETASASAASSVTVVTGHQADLVKAALDGLEVGFVDNPDYAEGLSTSLRAGVAALPPGCDAAIVCLGDMPGIDTDLLDRLIDAYDPEQGKTICVPVRDGKRGNPVLWGKAHFRDLLDIAGDVGARHLIGENPDAVVEVPVENDAIFIDLDTPDAFDSYRRGDD